MPLIQCPDCTKQHSDAAVACPFCGRPHTRPKRSKILPKNKKQYAVDLVIGFFLAIFVALVASSILSVFLSLPVAIVNKAVILFTLVAFVVDLIRFKPSKENANEEEINKFFYFTFGPYGRLLYGIGKPWQPWMKAGAVLLIACVPVLMFTIDKLDSQAFLRNSNTAVAELAGSFSGLEECHTLSKCPEEYEKIAKVVRSYAIPRGAEGFVMVISKDNGIYRAISTEGAQIFSSRGYAPQPIPAANKNDKQAVIIRNFEPLFNQDFSQVISAFQTGRNSVEIARINTYKRSDSRLFRSLHKVNIKEHSIMIYIASDQGFLFTPRQEFFLQHDINR